MKEGSLVLINNENIIYVIQTIKENNICYIKGLNYRIRKVVNIELLRLATQKEIDEENEYCKRYLIKASKMLQRNNGYLLGKILHLDGDDKYLNKCLELYETLGVYANGIAVDEEKMENEVLDYLDYYRPDIVIITGHDLYNDSGKKDLKNYTNTNNFIKTIKKIRSSPLGCSSIIVAGACQSNYEALIASGADFASSPDRINIHTFDPAIIAVKAATTSFSRIIDLNEALKYIENGRKAFGGIETFGKMRLII